MQREAVSVHDIWDKETSGELGTILREGWF